MGMVLKTIGYMVIGVIALLIVGGVFLQVLKESPQPSSKVARPVAQSEPAPAPPKASAQDSGISFRTKIDNQERQYDEDMLTAIDGILNASSFAERAKSYCKFTIEQGEILTNPGRFGGKLIEQRYRELLASRPTTQEGEMQRQREIKSVEGLLLAHRTNLQQCEEAVGNGWQRIPSDEELRVKAQQAREEIADIDRTQHRRAIEKSPKPQETETKDPSTGIQEPAQPRPSAPDSPPVVLRKVEPEYSPEARRANFNGSVQALVQIDAEGKVTDVRVLNSPPGLNLGPKIIAAIWQWKFKPAIRDGSPIGSSATVTVNFRQF